MANHQMKRNLLLIILFSALFSIEQSAAQKSDKPTSSSRIAIGFNYGIGNQAAFPFDNPNYQYKNDFYKAQFRYAITNKKQWNFEFVVEPGYYRSKHRLLNKFYITPESGDDYLERREKFLQERTINEYVLQLSLLCRYSIFKDLSAYAIGGVGPMILDEESERQAKGYSFSDVGGLGLMYQLNRIYLDLRVTFRHVSNLEFIQPNEGYNMVGIEFGISTKI